MPFLSLYIHIHTHTHTPGERNGNPLQYSCLENSMDREAWWATVHGVAKGWTWLKQLNHMYMYTYVYIYRYRASLVTQTVKKSACNAGDPDSFPSLGIPLEWGIPIPLGIPKGMASHSSILAWKIPWREKPGGLQSIGRSPAKQKTQVPLLSQQDPLKKGMATHSSILAWRIPQTRGAWWTIVHGVTKSQTWLSD